MSNKTQTPTWLFTFAASKLKVKQMNSNSKDYRFRAKKKHVSEVSLFSERPDRLTSKASSEDFKDSFNAIFKSDKPNASISYWHKGNSSDVFEMKNFRDSHNNSSYIMDVSMLDDNHNLSKDNVFENVSFFVDSGWLCPVERLFTHGLLCVLP